jgi:hypothetical protein
MPPRTFTRTLNRAEILHWQLRTDEASLAPNKLAPSFDVPLIDPAIHDRAQKGIADGVLAWLVIIPVAVPLRR